MTQDSTDSPDPTDTPQITAEQVVAYLARNPDFLSRHPEALDNQLPPERALGDGVVDFQSAMIDRLRADVAGQTVRHRELLDTSRANLSIQSRIHECILALLEARSFEKVIEAVATDLTVLLDLDVVALCVESESGEWAGGAAGQGLRVIARGTVDTIFGTGEELILRCGIEGNAEAFGEAASLVRSEALVRLEISASTPPALLAFGSRDSEKFHPGQATELIGFLAAALESIIRGWLTLPD
ncbi:MAG: DUF484 family protein [Rickettsiales bacterium]